jgi:exoribonuclease R
MRAPTDNETWVIETGDTIIRKKARGGIECLTLSETLVYCLWVADYGMRNAGDLDAAADVYAEFHSNARRIAEVLSIRLTHDAFTLPQSDLEREYFDRFESICNEIRAAERRPSSGV